MKIVAIYNKIAMMLKPIIFKENMKLSFELNYKLTTYNSQLLGISIAFHKLKIHLNIKILYKYIDRLITFFDDIENFRLLVSLTFGCKRTASDFNITFSKKENRYSFMREKLNSITNRQQVVNNSSRQIVCITLIRVVTAKLDAWCLAGRGT